ncbi:MAG: phage holin family protein [Egibacteraceae bacterium]
MRNRKHSATRTGGQLTNSPNTANGQIRAPEAATGVLKDVAALIRAEVALAKAEVEQSIRNKVAGAGLLSGACALVWLSVQGLLVAIALALAAVLPAWAAALIVSGVLLLIGAILGGVGRHQLAAKLGLDVTTQNVHEDLALAKSCLPPNSRLVPPQPSPISGGLTGRVAAVEAARTTFGQHLNRLTVEGRAMMRNQTKKIAWKALGAGGVLLAGLTARNRLHTARTKAHRTDPPSIAVVPDQAAKLAAKAQAKGSELAAEAQRRSEALADRGLRHLGERLSQGRLAEPLGIQPHKRRLPVWPTALLGIAGGYAIAVLTTSKTGVELREKLASRARSVVSPRVETIRSQLSQDPRTATLPDLDVTIDDRTVFVQGTVPPDFDQDMLREVIAQVPGVHDVDLQVAARA